MLFATFQRRLYADFHKKRAFFPFSSPVPRRARQKCRLRRHSNFGGNLFCLSPPHNRHVTPIAPKSKHGRKAGARDQEIVFRPSPKNYLLIVYGRRPKNYFPLAPAVRPCYTLGQIGGRGCGGTKTSSPPFVAPVPRRARKMPPPAAFRSCGSLL